METANFLKPVLDNPQGAVFFIFALAVALGLFLVSRRIALLTKGGDGKSLESTIKNLARKVEALEEHAAHVEKELADKERRLARSIQGVSVKRFDPFKNAGGQQSFATALLDEKGDGAVISGIHARDGVRVYAKSVSTFASERELSEEEATAIEEARKKLN